MLTYFDFVSAKHPEIKQLMVYDPHFKYEVMAIVLFQFFMVYIVANTQMSWLYLTLITYLVSGTMNHSILLAQHDITHNNAFGYTRPLANKIFSLFANLPIGVPMAISFRRYHLEHHKFLAHEYLDTDVPTAAEAVLFRTSLGKAIWLFLQPFFYALRPLVLNPKITSDFEAYNITVQFIFNFIVLQLFGYKSLFYMVIGSLLGMGFHPVAGHFISEHYMFSHGFETYSYYGILNKVTFNVGYHNEHHDFPNIPSSLLPKVREIAPEYYNTIPYHTSWVKVLYNFVFDPAIGPYARIKRRDYVYRKSQGDGNNNRDGIRETNGKVPYDKRQQ